MLLAGADTILIHVLDEKLEDVHTGMRVQAVWKPREEWTTSTAFMPIDEPMLRVHGAGGVGSSNGIVAASVVQSGIHDRVLCIAFEKQSESNASWALSLSLPFS